MIYVSAIDRDLARKFKNRRQSEYKFLDQLFEKCHSSDSSPASVTESPRKPFCSKNSTMSEHFKGAEWQEHQKFLGRKRKTVEQFMATTAVSLKSSFQSSQGGLDVNVQVTLSPSKLNKRQRIARQHPNTTSGLS